MSYVPQLREFTCTFIFSQLVVSCLNDCCVALTPDKSSCSRLGQYIAAGRVIHNRLDVHAQVTSLHYGHSWDNSMGPEEVFLNSSICVAGTVDSVLMKEVSHIHVAMSVLDNFHRLN